MNEERRPGQAQAVVSWRLRRLLGKLERALLGAAMSAVLWVAEHRLSRSTSARRGRPNDGKGAG